MDETRAQRKTIVGLALLALTGWGALWVKAKTPPTVKERIVYQDRVVVKDRIVVQDKTKTTTLPNGTKIVEVSKSVETATEREHVAVAEKLTTTASEKQLLPKYSLGVSALFDYRNPLKREYTIELGKRLWNSPISGTLAVSTNKQISFGLRFDF